jgi:hypothetical protein
VAAQAENPAGWRTPRWVAPLVGGLSLLFVLVVGGGLIADWTLRNSEMRDLVTAIEESERQMQVTQDKVRDVFAPFEVGGELTPEETALLTAQLSDVAADAQERIERAGAGVAAVTVMPWHLPILRAQEAYVVHNGAWVDYMARAAQDPVEFINPQPFVNESFFATEPLLTAAVPTPALYDIDRRVQQIFIDGVPEDFEMDEPSDTASS